MPGVAPAGAVEVQQEGPAANAKRLRLHHAKHHLQRDGCVHRTAALSQHIHPRLHRQRVGGGHHFARGESDGFGFVSRR